MSVENTYSPIKVSGDDATTEFSFNFTVYSKADLVVQLIDKDTDTAVTQTLDTHYTVTISPTAEGGTIDFIGGVVPTSDEWVFMQTAIADTQPVSFPIGDGIREESVELMADRIVRLIQQLKAKVDRSIITSLAEDALDLVIPQPEADKLLGWDADGEQLENKTMMDADAQAAAEAASTLAIAAAAAAEISRAAAVVAQEAAEAVAGWTAASQAQAEAGTDNTTVMTPLRVKQSIDVNKTTVGAPGATTQVTATTGVSNATSSFVTLTDMTFTYTPAHADNPILILFSGSFSNSVSNKEAEIKLYIDGSAVEHTRRLYAPYIPEESGGLAFHHYTTLSAAAHTIEARMAAVSGGTAKAYNRTFTIIETKQNV